MMCESTEPAMPSVPQPEASRAAGPVRRLYDWVRAWADSPYALGALALLSFAESSFFPIPPDVLLIAMCLGMPKRGLWYAGVCSVASVVGGLFGYAIGALLWENLQGFFFQYIPGFTPESFAMVQTSFNEMGWLLVFMAGFSPIPYKLLTITSGVMGLPILPFLAASAVSRTLRFYLVAGGIYVFGEPVKEFIDRYFNLLAILFCVLLAGGFVVLKWLV